MSYNKVILMGRLTADPERRVTQTGVEAAVFTVATNRPKSKDGRGEADFLDCVAWRSVAEFINKYFSKGKPILVEGRAQTRIYENKAGVKQKRTEIIVSAANFVEGERSKEAMLPEPPPERGDVACPTVDVVAPDNFAEVDPDGDLPF